ncbi:glycosyltransferase family 2 protein [Microbacterium resistens]
MKLLTRGETVAVCALVAAAGLGVLWAAGGFTVGAILTLCGLTTVSAVLLLRSRRGLPRLRFRRRRARTVPASTMARMPRHLGGNVDVRRVDGGARPLDAPAPRLSIVMPVHDVAPYLESAILSVLYQDLQDFELILVDDGSTDGSDAIIEMYATLDQRIRTESLEHNSLGGAGIPSNIGMRIARGRYLGFVDSDDVLLRGAFARLLEIAEREDADVVVGGFATFSDEDRVVSDAYDLPRLAAIPRGQVISATSHPTVMELSPVPWRKLYRMSFIEQFGIEYPEGDHFFEDNPLHWAVLAVADRVVVVDDIVSLHRTRREGQTMNSAAHRKGAIVDHMATAMRSILATAGDRREALLSAYVERLYASRWVVRQQTHSGAQAMLAKRFAALFGRAVAEGARIPLPMRRTVESYRGSYPAHDLTVVVPAYNAASKVKRTLDSLLAIRNIDCDIIVVDDGSTDRTLAVLRDYESAHGNVHVFSQQHKGAGRARNSVLPLITGTYFLTLDAGDRVDPVALSACVLAAMEQQADLLMLDERTAAAPPDPGTASGPRETQAEACSTAGAAAQPAVAWNRLVRTAHLHDQNLYFGGAHPYEDVLFHWHSVTSAARIARARFSVVERTNYAKKRFEREIVAAHGDALHDTLWYTQRRIGTLAGYDAVSPAWLQFVSGVLAETRERLPIERVEAFDTRSAALWEELSRWNDGSRAPGDRTATP